MPYISSEQRRLIDDLIEKLTNLVNSSPSLISKKDGVVNYIITNLLIQVYERSYSSMCHAVGTAMCAIFEFYRRRMIPYENEKIVENGDVYPDERRRI